MAGRPHAADVTGLHASTAGRGPRAIGPRAPSALRGLLAGCALLAAAWAAPPAFAQLPPHENGLVPAAWREARALAYLEYATSVQSPGSVLNAIAHMERDAADPGYTAPSGVVDVADWQHHFDKLAALQDTRDFDGLYLLNALLGYEGHPYLTPAAWAAVRASLLGFKYWITDPTPPMPDPTDPTRDWDESIYWTENHQALYHTIEYLMGQENPDACFTIIGFAPSGDCSGAFEMTGRQHRDRARAFLMRWLDERWRWGFSEWHSNIYYQKDATPLLTLVEYAADGEIRDRARMILDVLMLDLATHTFQGVLGVTHGRSEMKDTYAGTRNDTWGLVHLLFGQQDAYGYASTGDPGATLFARAGTYALPWVILEAAHAPGSLLDRTRMSVPLDESAPLDPDPAHPPGHPFDLDEPSFTFWFGLGAWTAWQVVPISLWAVEAYDLASTEFFAPFAPLIALLGDPPDVAAGQQLAQVGWPILSLGLLKEVNSYTYRTPHYVLSTAQDYRKGANVAQVRAWQATLGHHAMVFTTHPMNPVQPPSEWIGRSDGQPGYWSGSASNPRSAQHANVGIHIYEPAYPDGGLAGSFDYEALTHAYFPQDHFDEVVQSGAWTLGRLGDAYVALYSWRATTWQAYDPAELALLPESATGPVGSSFDLVAEGGADNVWIVECGSADEWGSFEAFRDAILAADVVVDELAEGFDVAYVSPSQGTLSLGWQAPFVVRGREAPLEGHSRVDNGFANAWPGARRWIVRGSGTGLVLDWQDASRALYVPEPAAGLAGLAALVTLAAWMRRRRLAR